MQFSVEYVAYLDCVTLTISGKTAPEELSAARTECIEMLDDHHCSNLLVDATGIEAKRSVLDDYQFTTSHAMHFPPGTRHAIVVRATEEDYMQFVENVGQNRGIDINVFIDRGKALDWLLGR